jgi:hypothetical protein
MDLKPSNFLVSLVSLLGVILPGTVVVYLGLAGALRPGIPRQLVSVPEASVEGWVIFVIASYAVGQALYAFGSWFLDPIYDRTYRRYKQHLKGDPKKLVQPIIASKFAKGTEPSTYSWARAYVATKSPLSVGELEQIEADFKFFRSLALVFVIAPYEAVTIHGKGTIALAAIGVALLMLGAVAKLVVDIRESTGKPRDPSRTSLSLDISAGITGAGFVALVAVACNLVLGAEGAWAAIAYVVGFGVVLLRFCQQRWQRNETTYEYAATIGR